MFNFKKIASVPYISEASKIFFRGKLLPTFYSTLGIGLALTLIVLSWISVASNISPEIVKIAIYETLLWLLILVINVFNLINIWQDTVVIHRSKKRLAAMGINEGDSKNDT